MLAITMEKTNKQEPPYTYLRIAHKRQIPKAEGEEGSTIQLEQLFGDKLPPDDIKIDVEQIVELIKAATAREVAERKDRASSMHLTYTLATVLSIVSATCLWMVGSACINTDRSKKFKV